MEFNVITLAGILESESEIIYLSHSGEINIEALGRTVAKSEHERIVQQ